MFLGNVWIHMVKLPMPTFVYPESVWVWSPGVGNKKIFRQIGNLLVACNGRKQNVTFKNIHTHTIHVTGIFTYMYHKNQPFM